MLRTIKRLIETSDSSNNSKLLRVYRHRIQSYDLCRNKMLKNCRSARSKFQAGVKLRCV